MVTDIRPLQVSAPYRRLFLGNTVAQLGQQMSNVAVAIQVYALTHSSFYVGLVGVFALVPLVVLGLYGGAIADAVDRRLLALVASAGLWSVSIALLVQAYLGNTSVWVLYGCIAVQSGFYAVNNPARSAMVPRLLDRELISAAAALNMASANLGMTLGPVLGALVVGWGGFAVAYGVDVVTFAAAYYALLRMPPMPPLHDSPRAGLKSVLDGLRFLRRSPNLRMTFILDLCAMVLAQPRALFPALAYKVYGGGAGVVGLLQAAPAAGAIVAFLFSGWISQGAPAGAGDRDRGAGLRSRGRRGRAHRRAVDRGGVPGGLRDGRHGQLGLPQHGAAGRHAGPPARPAPGRVHRRGRRRSAGRRLPGRVGGEPHGGAGRAGARRGGLHRRRAHRERAVAAVPGVRRAAPDALTPVARGRDHVRMPGNRWLQNASIGYSGREPDRDTEDMTDTVQTTAAQASHVEEPMSHREVLEALSGLLLALFVAMLSSTVVTNALPRIVTDLNGSESGYTWIVVATLLTMTASTPVWGKLADLFNKKMLVQTALVIYSIGSLIAAVAPNMGSLIAARAVQGLGVGGLTALVQVVIASIVSPRERGRYSGYIGAVFALATVSGPLIGGVIVDSPLGWRGCFFVGLPIAVIAFGVLQKTLHVQTVKREVSIDYLGAVLLTGGVSTLLIWVSLAGHDFDWASVTTAWMIALGLLLLVAAVVTEMRAKEPIIPLRLFRDRTTSLATFASVMIGIAMFGSTVYLSQYFQIAHGMSPTHAGLMTIAMVGGLMVSSLPPAGSSAGPGVEALPRRRHGPGRHRPRAALHHRRGHQPGAGRRVHGGPRRRPRRHDAEPRAGRAEQHRPARHGLGQLGGRVLPLDGWLDRGLGARRGAQPPGRRQRRDRSRPARRRPRLGGQQRRHPGPGHPAGAGARGLRDRLRRRHRQAVPDRHAVRAGRPGRGAVHPRGPAPHHDRARGRSGETA